MPAAPDYLEEIRKAVFAHGAWKRKLQIAVAAGAASELTVEQAQADDHCEFGRWFYSLPADVRASPAAQKIRQLHADFHGEAAHVLALAKRGEAEAAGRSLGPGTKFSTISAKLAVAMQQWGAHLPRRIDPH